MKPKFGATIGALAGIGGLARRSLNDTLSQTAQNGGGCWGTLLSPTLPASLGDGQELYKESGDGCPWGNLTISNDNPYTSQPNTGHTRFYNFLIAKCAIAPDGVRVDKQLCINGQFPGPLIEANYGDFIEVTVHNDLKDVEEGTSLHWHGMLQKGTPWADGVPSISQCPIAPGQSYTYRFRADLYGTSWYHSHYSAQYVGGAFGPLVVYGPASKGHDIDLGPVMLQDYYHNNYDYLVSQAVAPDATFKSGGPNSPASQNVLINGKMVYNCSRTSLPCTNNAKFSKFRFQSGKVQKLRLINTGAQAIQKFSIDDHNLTVIANDFVPVQPYDTDHVSLGIGQRADVLVNGTGKPYGAYWMRSSITGACSTNDGISPVGLAAIYYEKAATNTVPSTKATYNDNSPQACANAPLQTTIPSYEMAVTTPSTTEAISIQLKSNGTHMVYFLNDVNHHTDFNIALLEQAHQRNLSFKPDDAVYNFGTNKTVRLVFYNHDTSFHPMHLHGHNFQVLNVGYGTWNGSVVRASNPQRRDTQLMPPAQGPTPSYLAMQWTQDNPGVWPLHCHLAWHLSAGLFLAVLERPQELASGAAYSAIGGEVAKTCSPWGVWTSKHTVDTIDDGA